MYFIACPSVPFLLQPTSIFRLNQHDDSKSTNSYCRRGTPPPPPPPPPLLPLTLTMSAIAALVASRSPSLYIHASIPYEEYTTVCLSHSWDENAGTAAHPRWVTRTRNADVPFAPDSQDKECLLRVVHEYRDAIQHSCLNITDAQEIYDNFRLTLGGDLCTTWDQTVTKLLQTLVPPTAAALAAAVTAGLPPPPATNWARTDANFLTEEVPHFL